MRSLYITSLAAAAVFAGSVSVPEANARTVELTYKLPKGTVGFAVSHTISKCPLPSGDGLEMEVTTAIKPVYGAGDTVRIDASGKLFVDRSVKLEFYDNGTIKSFNATSTGQGGKIVAAGIKLASFAGSVAIGVSPALPPSIVSNPSLECHEWVKGAIASKDSTTAYLATLESQVVASGLSERLAGEIAATKEKIAALDALLTIKAKPVYWTPVTGTLAFSGTMKAGNLGIWFKPVPEEVLSAVLERAGYGQTQEFALTGEFETTSKSEADSGDRLECPASDSESSSRGTEEPAPSDPSAICRGAVKSLVYREPLTATVKMKPAKDLTMPAGTDQVKQALAAMAYSATEQSLKAKIPQVGSARSIPFDGSGIFGSRAVSATFAESGDLTSVGFTSTGGADALAGVLDAATAAGTELRGARLNNIKQEVELRTKEKELEDLIDQEAPVGQ